MSKITLLILICSFIIMNTAMAQIEKNNFLLETSFNYYYKNEKNDRTELLAIGNTTYSPTILNETQINYLTKLKLAYAISENFTAGVSFQYKSSKTKTKSLVFISYNVNPITFEFETKTDENNSKLKIAEFIPSIFVEKYVKIVDKIYFLPNLNFSYHRQEYKGESFSGQLIENTSILSSTGDTYKSVRNKWSFNLSTALFFRIHKRLGLQLKFGRASYIFKPKRDIDLEENPSLITIRSLNEAEKEKGLTIDISPLNWEYGLVFILNKNKLKE